MLRALLLMIGCASEVAYMPLNKPPHALSRRSRDSVELFTAAAPQREYVEVGMLDATSPAAGGSRASPWVDAAYLTSKLRKQAGDYGCDGLVVTGGGTSDEVRGT